MNAQTLLALFLAEAREHSLWTWGADEARTLTGVQLTHAAAPATRARVVLLAAEALAVPDEGSSRYDTAWSPALGFLIADLLPGISPWELGDLSALCASASRWPAWDWMDTPPYDAVLDVVARELDGAPPGAALAQALRDLRLRLAVEGAWDDAQRVRFARLDAILAGARTIAAFDPSEPWGEAANAWIVTRDASRIPAWEALIAHCATAVRSLPSARWREEAARLVAPIGPAELILGLSAWLPHVPMGLTRAQAEQRRTLAVRYQVGLTGGPPTGLSEENRVRVRGLCWACALLPEDTPAPAVARVVELLRGLATAGYARVPGVGPGDRLLANAAVRALGGLPGARGRRALLQLREAVAFERARSWIDRVLAEMEDSAPS